MNSLIRFGGVLFQIKVSILCLLKNKNGVDIFYATIILLYFFKMEVLTLKSSEEKFVWKNNSIKLTAFFNLCGFVLMAD